MPRPDIGPTLAELRVNPLDHPESFARDRALGAFGRSDTKVSELLWIGPDTLLVLTSDHFQSRRRFGRHGTDFLTELLPVSDNDSAARVRRRSSGEHG